LKLATGFGMRVVFLDFLRFNYPSQNLPVPILEANWWRELL